MFLIYPTRIAKGNIVTTIASQHDMVRTAWDMESWFVCHEESIVNNLDKYNYAGLSPFPLLVEQAIDIAYVEHLMDTNLHIIHLII